MGNVIIIGRGANLVTAHMQNVFHVRLVAPMENRTRHMQDIFNLTRKEAIARIQKDDRMRKQYLLHHYHKDIEDEYLYHLIINTNLVTYEEAADIICTHVMSKYPQYFRTE